MSANKIKQDELKQIIDPKETTPEGRESVEGIIKENVEAGLKDLTVDKIEQMNSEQFLTAVLDKANTDVFGALSKYLTENIESEELRDGYIDHVKGGLRALILDMINDSAAAEEVKGKLRELFEVDESQAVESFEELAPQAASVEGSTAGQDNQQSNEDVEALFDETGDRDTVNLEISLHDETVLLPTEETLDVSMKTVELEKLRADGCINHGLGRKRDGSVYQEDGIAFDPDTRQFAVVDGAGGHGGSSLVTEKLCKGYKEMLKGNYDSVRSAISQAEPFNNGGAVFVMGGIGQDNVLRGIFCGDARLMVVKPDGRFVFLTNEESVSAIGRSQLGRHVVETLFQFV